MQHHWHDHARAAEPPRSREPQRHEAGMVTAETAMVIPFLVALAFTLVWACAMGITEVRLVDAAREGARMVARGDDRDAVRDGVEQMVPERTAISVTEGADATTRVTVRHRARIDLPLVRTFSLELEASAASVSEAVDR